MTYKEWLAGCLGCATYDNLLDWLHEGYTLITESMGDMVSALRFFADNGMRMSNLAEGVLLGRFRDRDYSGKGILWSNDWGIGIGLWDRHKTIRYEDVEHLLQEVKIPKITQEEFEAAFKEMIG